ncbi:MAG: rRNA maturation RNase YbeY [Candidatus Cloacimonetes bacterium]|nr:rRNA maturation RNase YbeY [Candidatus Cloacimonadota bacterium]MBS3767943.1 rRNA maturation RNase YbeY [Candidatus Cloacimonadota bacterium]
MLYNFEIIQIKENDLNIRRLQRLIKRIIEQEEINPDYKLNIVLTNNERLQELNKKFKDIDRPTDVLSFSFDEDEVEVEPLLGEVYISLEKAKEQSQKYDVTLQNEVERLMVHGILHLIGWEHQSEKDAKKMFSKIESYLSYHTKKDK